MFADCCRERVGNVPLGAVPGTLDDRDNGSVLTAVGCDATSGDLRQDEPPANEDPDTQRGYFTKALLEGLSGAAADPPGYGAVDTNSLARYVKQRVKDLTRKFKRPQDPRMDADPAEPIVFRPAAAPPAADVPTGGLPAPTSYQVRIEFVNAVSRARGPAQQCQRHPPRASHHRRRSHRAAAERLVPGDAGRAG